MYILVLAKRYADIPCFVKGHVKDVAMQLAKFARSKAKGRMTDFCMEGYAITFEKLLREDAEKEETKELQLTAYASPFEYGTSAGRCMKVVVPTTILDIYDEPVEFEWWDKAYRRQA